MLLYKVGIRITHPHQPPRWEEIVLYVATDLTTIEQPYLASSPDTIETPAGDAAEGAVRAYHRLTPELYQQIWRQLSRARPGTAAQRVGLARFRTITAWMLDDVALAYNAERLLCGLEPIAVVAVVDFVGRVHAFDAEAWERFEQVIKDWNESAALRAAERRRREAEVAVRRKKKVSKANEARPFLAEED